MRSILLVIVSALVSLNVAAEPSSKNKMTYFSCVVTEEVSKTKSAKITVKFAVKGLDLWKEKGELVQYPGSNEESGAISVSPEYVTKDYLARMANLNGQGGDLRIEGSNLRLWGDGAGYQFTELVIWDVDEDDEEDPKTLEGYVRDYGPAYNGKIDFKQFIKCTRSSKVL